jgi:hypothetical protein
MFFAQPLASTETGGGKLPQFTFFIYVAGVCVKYQLYRGHNANNMCFHSDLRRNVSMDMDQTIR